jgi:ferritin
MLSKPMQKALNDQIKYELYSSYLYLAMSAYSESQNYSGFAKWLKVQSEEENGHAMKLYRYVHERSGIVTLQALDQPPADFKNQLELFKKVQEHEQKVTRLITKLYELAVKENDYPTQFLLQWFINEQIEEEKNVADILEQMKRLGDVPISIMMLDRQLGMRAPK